MRVLFGIILLLTAISAALAASERDWADCESTNPERIVTGCTAVIDDGAVSAADRVRAYDRRGYIHLMRRELERAIADFTAALRADPDRPFSLYARGMARLFSGDAAGQNEMESALLRRPQVADEFKAFGR
jgi:tetratricopeptide (TPR) repeat protein